MMKKINIILLSSAIAFGAYGIMGSGKPEVITDNGEKVGIEIGNKAPELLFNDPDGKPIALSSLRGKVVLIDFWASWCGPCRRDNPNVVSAYEKYKDAKFEKAKGFAIYSVSLDKDKGAWVGAIKNDNLSWKYHVSDLQAWASQAARIYGVSGIPANFLLNAQGIIVAKNLRGPILHTEIEKLLKKTKEGKPKEAELYMTK